MAFGVHIFVLRLVGDGVGMQPFERGDVPRRIPARVKRERIVLCRRRDGVAIARAFGQDGEGIFVHFGKRCRSRLGDAARQRAEVFGIAGEAPRAPRTLQRRRDAAAVAGPLGVAVPVDFVGIAPDALRILLAVRHPAVDHAGHQPARGGIAVVQADQDRRVHDGEGIGFLPRPGCVAIHLAPAVPAGGEMQVAGGILQDHALQGARRFHQSLDRLGLAPVEVEAFGVGVQPLLIGVQLVGGDIAQAIDAHAVGVDRIGQRAQRGVHLVGLDPHQRQARPLLRQVGIVRNAAAEVAIGNLAVIDPPVDEAADVFQVLELAERPQRLALGRDGLGEGRQVFGAIVDIRPIGLRLLMVRIDPQQVGDVGEQAAIQRHALR